MTRQSSVGTPATVALNRAKVAYAVHPYEHVAGARSTTPSYGEEAAAALCLSPAVVFKTLVADVDGALVVAIVPVSGQLDLKALAAAVGGKRAAMADVAAAERATGYVTGGISPFGQRRRLISVLDSSALDRETIFVSAGRRGVDLSIAPADLVRVLDARVAAIGRPISRS